jgi:hypothetical protein
MNVRFKTAENAPRFASVDDPAFDTRRAAGYLGVSPTTLEIWRSTGRYGLPFEKIGRAVRYRQSALDAFIAARTFTSTGAYDAD